MNPTLGKFRQQRLFNAAFNMFNTQTERGLNRLNRLNRTSRTVRICRTEAPRFGLAACEMSAGHEGGAGEDPGCLYTAREMHRHRAERQCKSGSPKPPALVIALTSGSLPFSDVEYRRRLYRTSRNPQRRLLRIAAQPFPVLMACAKLTQERDVVPTPFAPPMEVFRIDAMAATCPLFIELLA